jgi:nitrite reductase/ring-hydroxylating ferredoxin subunit
MDEIVCPYHKIKHAIGNDPVDGMDEIVCPYHKIKHDIMQDVNDTGIA